MASPLAEGIVFALASSNENTTSGFPPGALKHRRYHYHQGSYHSVRRNPSRTVSTVYASSRWYRHCTGVVRLKHKHCLCFFFFFRILHTISSHLRAHAFARSVTVARSSAVQASSSRRQERSGPSSVAPHSRNPPTGRHRDSPISSSLFLHGPLLCAVG